MKLTQDLDPTLNIVRAYSPGEVRVGEHVLTSLFPVAAQALVAGLRDPGTLTLEQLEPVWQLQPQVVLLGTGARQVFPPASIRREFAARGIALEPMDTGAACRTYNVLLQEDRLVGGSVPMIDHTGIRLRGHRRSKRFYSAALAAGGRDNGAPGPRPHYHENYYGAFVLDPDGHNIEAVCHDPV